MVNKQLCLILVCALSMGQIMASDSNLITEKNVAPLKKGLKGKKKNIWDSGVNKSSSSINKPTPSIDQSSSSSDYIVINIPGKMVKEVEITDTTEVLDLGNSIDDLLEQESNNIDELVTEMNENIDQYKKEASSLSLNSVQFVKAVQEKIVKFNSHKTKAVSVQKYIQSEIIAGKKETQKISAAVGFGFRASDKAKIEQAAKVINQILLNIKKNYEEVASMGQEIADEVSLFGKAAKLDAAQEAEVAAKKAQKVAAENAAQAAIKFKEAKQAKNKEEAKQAAEKAEAKAKAAEALTKQKALEEAQAAEELAKKKAELLYKNTQVGLDKIAYLRDVLESVVKRNSDLFEKVTFNPSMYPAEFVKEVSDTMEPKVQEIIQEFNTVIGKANTAINTLQDLEKELKGLERQLEFGVSLSKQGEIDNEMGDVLSKMEANHKIVPNLLAVSEEYTNNLFDIYGKLFVAEKNNRVVNPKSVEHVLELVHAVKIEQNQQKMIIEGTIRMNLERKEVMLARVLELIRAVKLA